MSEQAYINLKDAVKRPIFDVKNINRENPRFKQMVDSYQKWNQDDYFKSINREKTPEQKQAWEQYLKKNEELEERRKKGMLLFAEYYQQLWD